jgi:predicted DNA binding protein
MISECLGVEMRIEADDCPLADAVRTVAVSVDARPPQLRDDGNALLRFSAPESDALSEVLDADDRLRYLYRSRAAGRDSYRCLSLNPCVVHDLVSAGLLVDALTYEDGAATVTGAVVGQNVLQGVMEAASEIVGVELKRVYALGPGDDAPVEQRWDLTPAQAESLRVAVEMGYFTVPRRVTASEVAAALDISKSAFLERLRRAQNRLLAQVLGVEPPR